VLSYAHKTEQDPADILIYIDVENEDGDSMNYRYQIHIQPLDKGCEIQLSRKL
jgi:hypothetical protein